MFSKRIIELANLLPFGVLPIDVGTDHCYLLIELFKKNKIKKAIGIDNKIGPIENAKKNLIKYKLIDKVDLKLADGLNFKFDKDFDTLIFAGLGALNVIEILSKNLNKIFNIKYILTDIHRNEDKLIEYLNGINFFVEKENRFIDKKINYHIVLYKRR